MSTLDELERELGSALRATLDEMITGPDDPDTAETSPEPRRAPVMPGTERAAHRQRRRAWVAAAAASIAVVTIGAMAWTQRPDSSVQTNTSIETTPTSSASTPLPSDTTLPTETPFRSSPSSDVALSWTPSDDTGSLARSTVTGIVAGPTGFVATGVGYDDQRNQGRVWFSPDGLTWQEPALDVFDTLVVSNPIATSTAFYVAAATNTDRTSDDEGEAQLTLPDAYLYRSEDGFTWQRWGESLGELPLIAAAGDGVLRYTRPNSDRDPRDPVERPKWWSADGSSWSRAAFEGDDVGSVGLLIDEFDAIAVAGTTYVAGYLHTDQGGEFGFWSSADGLAWERLPEPPGPGQFVSAAGAPLLVGGPVSGTYRYDPDLRTWENVVSDGSSPAVASVEGVGDLLVAATAADSGSLTVWTSPNANLDWQPDPNSTVQPDRDRVIVDAPLVAASGDRVVVAANLSSRSNAGAPTQTVNSVIVQVGVLEASPS